MDSSNPWMMLGVSTIDTAHQRVQTSAARSPYSKLDGPRLTRLLRLHPAQDFSADLAGKLVLHDLGESSRPNNTLVQYDALSYCWGKQGFPCIISLQENASLNITAHLDACFRNLRKTDEPRYLWVDAICINQKDKEEKSVQVRLMAQIFSKARTVRVWLAQEHPSMAALAKFFHDLGEVATHFQQSRRSCDDHREDQLYLRIISGVLKKAFGKATTMPLRAFFAIPWFTRRWILEEVALATDCMIHVGRFCFPWEWLVAGCNTLIASMEKDGFRLGSNECERTIEKICRLSNKKAGILDLLWSYDTSECFDPEDRLFALYSLASDVNLENSQADICACEWTLPQSQRLHYAHHRSPIRVKIDYACHWAEVYTQFARSAIESGHSSDILRHLSRFGSLSSVDAAWPSWVPNWRNVRWRRAVAFPIPDFRVPPLKIDHTRIYFRDILFGPVAHIVNYAEESDGFVHQFRTFAAEASESTRAWEHSIPADHASRGHTTANLAKDSHEIVHDRMPPYPTMECTIRNIKFLLDNQCEECISTMYTARDVENEYPPVLDSAEDTTSQDMRRALHRWLHHVFPGVLPSDTYTRFYRKPDSPEVIARDQAEEQSNLHKMLHDSCLFYIKGTNTDCPYLGIGPANMAREDYIWPPGGMTDYLVLRKQVEGSYTVHSSPMVVRYVGCCSSLHVVKPQIGMRKLGGPPGFAAEFMLV